MPRAVGEKKKSKRGSLFPTCAQPSRGGTRNGQLEGSGDRSAHNFDRLYRESAVAERQGL